MKERLLSFVLSPVGALVLVCAASTALQLSSLSSASAEVCPTSNVAGFSGTSDVIYVYLEADFSGELTQSNNKSIPPFEDDDWLISSYWLRNTLNESMDAWNSHSKGPELRFGVYVNSSWDDPQDACDFDMPNRPAVYVNFWPGCKETGQDEGDQECPSSAVATAHSIDGCSDAVAVTLWGNREWRTENGSVDEVYQCQFDSQCDDTNCASWKCRCHEPGGSIWGTCEVTGDVCLDDSYCGTHINCSGPEDECACEHASVQYCEYDVTNKNITWVYGSQREDVVSVSPVRTAWSVLVHEFGHVLGMGHATWSTQDPMPSGAAVRGAPRKCIYDHDCPDSGCSTGNQTCECRSNDSAAFPERCYLEPSTPCVRDDECQFLVCAPYDSANDLWLWQDEFSSCEVEMISNSNGLWRYDRECAHVNSAEREMGYRKVTWEENTPHDPVSYHGFSPVVTTSFGKTPFGTRGPGGWWASSASVNYPLVDVEGGTASMAKAYYDGYLNFAAHTMTNLPSLYQFASVSTYRLQQLSSSHELQMAQQHPWDWATERVAPTVRSHARYNGTWFQAPLEECLSSTCGSTEPIRSMQPVETANDPVTGLDVSAYVDETGNIRVVAGYDLPWLIEEQSSPHPGPNPGIQSPPENSTAWLESEGALPATDSIFSEWRYLGKTHGPVGLACGTGQYFNCLLAWTDFGVPNSEILYTYFRVVPGPPHDIHWFQLFGIHAAWELPFFANATTGVTAAFFNDAYHLAWKQASNASAVRYTYNEAGSYGPWSGTGSHSFDTYSTSDTVVGTPTFMAKDGRESGLIWTINN